jgi:diamine N-acetyltransferase
MHKSLHVALVPLTPADVPVLFEWINDRQQVILNAPYKPVHAGQHQAWFDAIQERIDVVIFGIRLTEAGRLIGSCQLHNIHPVHRSAELQIRLGVVAERGHGYGTEATRLLLDFAFKDLNLQRVYLHVLTTNQIAIRMYQKVGFVREGVLRSAAHIDGRYLDLLMMGILRDEYIPA